MRQLKLSQSGDSFFLVSKARTATKVAAAYRLQTKILKSEVNKHPILILEKIILTACVSNLKVLVAAELYIDRYEPTTCNKSRKSGDFACLRALFRLKRDVGYHASWRARSPKLKIGKIVL